MNIFDNIDLISNILMSSEQSLLGTFEEEQKKRDAFFEHLAKVLNEHPIMKLSQD